MLLLQRAGHLPEGSHGDGGPGDRGRRDSWRWTAQPAVAVKTATDDVTVEDEESVTLAAPVKDHGDWAR